MLFYGHGYRSVRGISKLDRTWRARMEESYRTGNKTRPLKGRYKGRVSYIDKLEQSYPGLACKCFRYAQRVIGNQSSYLDLVGVMNSKAASMADVHEAARFNSTNVFRWFRREGGNLKYPVEKPILIPEMKRERVLWCLREKKRIREWAEKYVRPR